MKPLILLALVALLLAGCTRAPLPTDPVPETTEALGLYDPDSQVEQYTGGAVRVYPLNGNGYCDLYTMGSNLLVAGDELLALSGEQGEEMAALDLNDAVSCVDVAATGAAYYISESRRVVVLNPQLQSTAHMQLPENIAGVPVICLWRDEVYFSTGLELRALNMSTGVSRLLRQQSASEQMLLGDCFDGTVLICQTTDAAGETHISYISSETGRTLSQEEILSVETYGEQYLVSRMDGVVHQMICGRRNGESKLFLAPEGYTWKAALEQKGAVGYAVTEEGLELAFFDLSAGKRTGEVQIPGAGEPAAIHSDGKYIWILTAFGEEPYQTLCRWDVSKSPVSDEAVYVAEFTTAANPDTEGLTLCRELADSIEEQHGVKMNIWQDAVVVSGGHTVTAEYHPQVITAMLEAIRPVLEQFPENFLRNTVENGWVRINLVRSIEGGDTWTQFWSEKDCWIVLSAEGNAAADLLQGIAYGVDSRVLGNSRDFDDWNDLNPAGFEYAYGDQVEDRPELLEGEGRAFTDLLAMTYPHVDRCRVFYNAMLPDNAEIFQSEIMQAKLLRLCEGIREAYGIEKTNATYPWEQYLNTSLAYED